MSRLCRLKTASHGDDGQWAYDEIVTLRKQRDELLEQVECSNITEKNMEGRLNKLIVQNAATKDRLDEHRDGRLSALEKLAVAEKQRDELLAENEQLRKDAERYRVLRDSEYQLDEDDPSVSDSFFNEYFGKELDSAVDELKSRFDSAIARVKGEQRC